MSKTPDENNVIQFPGAPQPTQNTALKARIAKERRAKVAPQAKFNLKVFGAIVAIMMASGAVNRYAFRTNLEQSYTLVGSNSARSIASVHPVKDERDASWEMNLAESLASPQIRSIASSRIGHTASLEDRLRWGTLQLKYTIVKPEGTTIRSISLPDERTEPAYILNRREFLDEFGVLLAESRS